MAARMFDDHLDAIDLTCSDAQARIEARNQGGTVAETVEVPVELLRELHATHKANGRTKGDGSRAARAALLRVPLPDPDAEVVEAMARAMWREQRDPQRLNGPNDEERETYRKHARAALAAYREAQLDAT